MSRARPTLVGLPVNLLVAGRRCVVVGAGQVAARKIATLLDLDAVVVVVAPRATDEVRGWARAGRLVLHERPFAPTDLDGAWLAITATGDPAVDRAVAEAGEARRVWVNAADDPANCTVTLLSLVRRGDIVVAIGTNGRSPALAAHLRERIGATIGPEYEATLELLAEQREAMRADGRPTEVPGWRDAFAAGLVELVREGRTDEARELLRRCL